MFIRQFYQHPAAPNPADAIGLGQTLRNSQNSRRKANHRGRIRYAVMVGKTIKTKVVADAWLVGYIRGTLFDALTPAQRMQFRMVSEKGPEAVGRWASESLAKYPVLWHRLKNAERQRRFRENARSPNWKKNWTRASKILGRRYVRELRKCAEQLGASNPGAALDAALNALNRELGASAQPPLAAVSHPPASGSVSEKERFG